MGFGEAPVLRVFWGESKEIWYPVALHLGAEEGQYKVVKVAIFTQPCLWRAESNFIYSLHPTFVIISWNLCLAMQYGGYSGVLEFIMLILFLSSFKPKHQDKCLPFANFIWFYIHSGRSRNVSWLT